jgi:hypothetical protein
MTHCGSCYGGPGAKSATTKYALRDHAFQQPFDGFRSLHRYDRQSISLHALCLLEMASNTTCLRLLRGRATSACGAFSYRPQTAAFSTTMAAQKAPVKLNSGSNAGARRFEKGKTIKLNKKAPPIPKRSPLPGERKAYRKRIVLTNDNALQFDGAQDLTAASMLDEANVPAMLRLPDKLVDQLRAAEAFKTTQCWNLFRWPHMLLRQPGQEIARRMQQDLAKKETTRLVLTGEGLVGKSMLLLQAIATAYCNDWIVINFPEGKHHQSPCSPKAPSNTAF